ncbi:alpha-acetolactate decarboxylase [Lasiosphaeria hispida]|uniref:Alpha-acetolactate decarboxylase n=1 Tax=Lasiosphaeria hispida TaxID=260671 RepID=A0AAJ0HCG6_9PEZI|nr:alpha-acetolactate decarboxylase [Lasiosphaeria hispida]
MAENEVYQYSIISALMDGVASHGTPISRVLEHGNHGLGTFRNMVGEMIVIDGTVYQMKSDGTVVLIDNPADTITPFATITRFRATTATQATITSKQDLSALLTRLFPSARNHFLAIRMDGVFKSINVRTAGGQLTPRERLPAVADRQTVHTFRDVKGTIIGFRSPDYIMGINVAGDHLHFIDEERKEGGHILAFETEGDVLVQVAQLSRFHVELPTEDEEFNEAALVKDEKGIAAVEG